MLAGVASAQKAQAGPDESLDSFATMKPVPLVALVGMQGLHDPLTSRRLQSHPDELAPRYISLEINTSFLDHQPGSGAGQENAILKRGWLHKHTYVSAAVVCLWLNFGSSGDIVTTWLGLLESFRTRCRPNCKIVVVILQSAKDGPLSSGVDERITTLRKSGELDAKSLFVLPTEGEGEARRVDEGSLRRLDKSLLDLALSYYKDGESRLAQAVAMSKKAQGAPKKAPQLLARHHFKRAYNAEVRRDAASAFKHWSASTPPVYLPYISRVSPVYLPYVSSACAASSRRRRWRPDPNSCPNPTPASYPYPCLLPLP